MKENLHEQKNRLWPLTLAALGVVFGDIGTSPLYALRESLHGLSISSVNILGVLSLIFWALILVISTRYCTIILRADNDGEGGVLALLSLLKKNGSSYKWLFLIGILGAGLLMGDGMITPAISVLSAVEGLKVITPNFQYLVIPFTLIILIALFMVQRFGTARIGYSFGPIILLWFFVIAFVGLIRLMENPGVLAAINPYYAYEFFRQGGWNAYAVLGGVFLVITGAEALYADLGHFGKKPIRIGWYFVALPALLLNYFGQGAYLLQHPSALENPFYSMSPLWFFYPLLILATLATIIASQAIISATFSIIKQSILLNLSPRFTIRQTSSEEKGQIYVPKINFFLGVGTVLLVLIFQNSSGLAAAYGLAVNLVMIGVAILVMFVAYQKWQWSVLKIVQVFSIFILIDFAFLGSTLHKFSEGGWIPVVFALVCATIMITWNKGMTLLEESFYKKKSIFENADTLFTEIPMQCIVNSTAIFIAHPYDQSGGSFLHYLKLLHSRPQRILLLSIQIEERPYVPEIKRFEMKRITEGTYRMILHYGFMQFIDIPKALSLADRLNKLPPDFHIEQAGYFVEMINVTETHKKYPEMYRWQSKIFIFFLRNSSLDIDFYRLPYNRSITIGTYCEI